MRIKNLHVLVTAAHVFDNFEKLLIPLENGKFMFKPGGEIIINTPETLREEDNIDIGILILDLISVNELETTYEFLDEGQISINHRFFENQDYLIFGFPSILNIRNIKERIT